MVFLLTVLAVLLVIEGIPYFAAPSKVKEWAMTLQEIPERTLRIMGFISMAAGLVALYFIKRYVG